MLESDCILRRKRTTVDWQRIHYSILLRTGRGRGSLVKIRGLSRIKISGSAHLCYSTTKSTMTSMVPVPLYRPRTEHIHFNGAWRWPLIQLQAYCYRTLYRLFIASRRHSRSLCVLYKWGRANQCEPVYSCVNTYICLYLPTRCVFTLYVCRCLSVSRIITLRAKPSGAVYYYRSCLCVCVFATGGRCVLPR